MVSILHREMRIASRREWFFLVRVVTSGLAFLCGLFLVLASRVADGQGLFTTLVFLSFWFWLIQGVRRASSSIADEKRDGTLGLLFLTDLTPRGIILGKLVTVAVPLMQPFLAFMPALSISMLLGGITGGEVLRAGVVLASVLIFSISVGLFVSSYSRDSEQTGNSTLLLLLATLILPRLGGHFYSPLRWLSPWTAYNGIPDPGYRVASDDFWFSLLMMNAVTGAALIGAAYFLPRRWDKEAIPQSHGKPASLRKRISQAKRARILDRNPGEWLATRYSSTWFDKWFFTGATFALAAAGGILAATVDSSAGFACLGAAVLVITIRLASQASYPLAEARRSGALEMVNTTPLLPRRLIAGQAAALRNQFFPQLGMVAIASIFCALNLEGSPQVLAFAAFVAIFWGISILILMTVATFGMWMGLREKSANRAFFKTIIFTLVLPFFFACLWFTLPVYYIILLIVSLTQLTGRDLERLVRGEQRFPQMGAVRLPRSFEAPPVIKP